MTALTHPSPAPRSINVVDAGCERTTLLALGLRRDPRAIRAYVECMRARLERA